MSFISLVIIILILLVSLIDAVRKQVPSVFLTAVILIALLYNISLNNINQVFFGIAGAIFSLALLDLDFIGGTGDIKVITASALILNSFNALSVYMVLLVVFGTIYKVILVHGFKKSEVDEVAFIPLIAVVTLIMGLLGGTI